MTPTRPAAETRPLRARWIFAARHGNQAPTRVRCGFRRRGLEPPPQTGRPEHPGRTDLVMTVSRDLRKQRALPGAVMMASRRRGGWGGDARHYRGDRTHQRHDTKWLDSVMLTDPDHLRLHPRSPPDTTDPR